MTVYFAQAGGSNGRIKIGVVSDRHLPQPRGQMPLVYRIRASERAAGLPVAVVALATGGRFVERWFHVRHGAAALGGEWFRPLDGLLEDVASLAAGQRVSSQPEEPSIEKFSARLARHYRISLFRIGQVEMAEALGLSISALRSGEIYGSSILRSIAYAGAAMRYGIPLALHQIVHEATAAAHRDRYRTHSVRQCGFERAAA